MDFQRWWDIHTVCIVVATAFQIETSDSPPTTVGIGEVKTGKYCYQNKHYGTRDIKHAERLSSTLNTYVNDWRACSEGALNDLFCKFVKFKECLSTNVSSAL